MVEASIALFSVAAPYSRLHVRRNWIPAKLRWRGRIRIFSLNKRLPSGRKWWTTRCSIIDSVLYISVCKRLHGSIHFRVPNFGLSHPVCHNRKSVPIFLPVWCGFQRFFSRTNSANKKSLVFWNNWRFRTLWYNSLAISYGNLLTIKPFTMLRWTIIFLVVAIIAAIFGFGGIAAGAASIAKILFYIFLVLFVLSLIAGGFRRVD